MPSVATDGEPRNLPCSHRLTRTAPRATPLKYTPFTGSSASGSGCVTVGGAMPVGLSREVSDRYASIADVSRSGSSNPLRTIPSRGGSPSASRFSSPMRKGTLRRVTWAWPVM